MLRVFRKLDFEVVGLVGVLLVGFFLRVFRLGVAPFWVDELISAVTALKITEIGLPVLDSGMVVSRALVFHYVQAFFLLFGQTDFLARFVSVVFGVATIFLAYKFGREYSRSGGLIAALFFAVFYLEVFYSRQARMYQMFQFFFFLTVYLLYRSKDDWRYVYFAIVSFFVTLDTQVEGLVLAPFIIGHILIYSWDRRWLSVFPAVPLVDKFFSVLGLTSGSGASVVSYVGDYFSFVSNMVYLLVFSFCGVVWGFVKNRRLSFLVVVPALVTLFGVFNLKTFAFRYSYFFIFVVLLYSALLFAFLYDMYGRVVLIPLVLVLVVPSNVFYEDDYVNVILPVDSGVVDYSAPFTDYKSLPEDLRERMEGGVLVSYFSLDVEWYLRKPDFVLPFSMNGIGVDQVSWNCSGGVCDRYSGARILDGVVEGDYWLVADRFSVSKLSEEQRGLLGELSEGCVREWEDYDLEIFYCS